MSGETITNEGVHTPPYYVEDLEYALAITDSVGYQIAEVSRENWRDAYLICAAVNAWRDKSIKELNAIVEVQKDWQRGGI